MTFIIGITCIASNRAIGYNGDIIFNLKPDMDFFMDMTTKVINPDKINAVIMGHNTYKTINKPLKSRYNCVISTKVSPQPTENIKYFSDITDCLNELRADDRIETIYVIGGQQIYQYFMERNLYDEIIISYIKTPTIDYGDAFFPKVDLQIYDYIERVFHSNINGNYDNITYDYSIYRLKKNYFFFIDENICKIFINTIRKYTNVIV